MQLEYSLVARDVESEHVPAARESSMGVMPWSPLAGGFLTGKYKREDTSSTGRLSGANPFGDSKFTPRNWDILEVLKSVSAELQSDPAQVALAWVMAQPGVASTLVGASSVSQLQSNIASTKITLDPQQIQRLNDASAPPTVFTSSLGMPSIRRMVFGGNNVSGWGEQHGYGLSRQGESGC